MSLSRAPWPLFATLVLAQIGYPLTDGTVRDRLVVTTIVVGFALSVGHAAATRGWRTATSLVTVTAGGGFAVEVLGVATGFPFGAYGYTTELGPRSLGVPLVIPLAWTWMAWPAWLAAVRIARGPMARVALAAAGLAAWDLFLDPQMVAEGYWTWTDPTPSLPGVPEVPVGNYLGWLGVSLGMMALLAAIPGERGGTAGSTPGGRWLPRAGADRATRADAPMYALYLWTYGSQILAHAVFLRLPASAGWGGLGMAAIAVPLAATLLTTSLPTASPATAPWDGQPAGVEAAREAAGHAVTDSPTPCSRSAPSSTGDRTTP